MPDLIIPDWPVPPWVRAFVTTRQGGVSCPPYASNNLAPHVGDAAQDVQRNRDRLIQCMPGCTAIQWLDQVHGTAVHSIERAGRPLRGDAIHTNVTGLACAVLTADCLPVLLSDTRGREVAVVHAGWRGLAAGILARAVAKFAAPSQQLVAWLGPAISQSRFEVGAEVAQQLQDSSVAAANTKLVKPSPSGGHKKLVDLYQIARLQLQAQKVSQISGGSFCTYADDKRFYSFRRDGVTGRMASVVYLAKA